MEKQRNIKILSVIALITAILGLTIAFAILSEKLEVTGFGAVLGNESNNTWDIHFANLSEATISSSAEVVTKPKILKGETAIETFEINLSATGDGVTYTFDVVNNGKVDAVLSNFIKAKPSCKDIHQNESNDAKNLCEALTYTLMYSDGTAISIGDTLNAGTSKSLTLTIELTGKPTSTDDIYISFEISEDQPFAAIIQYSQK